MNPSKGKGQSADVELPPESRDSMFDRPVLSTDRPSLSMRQLSVKSPHDVDKVKDKLNNRFSQKDKSKNEFQKTLDRLQARDPGLTALNLGNTTTISQRDENFCYLAAAIHGNPHLISVELSNVMMKDVHAPMIAEVWMISYFIKFISSHIFFLGNCSMPKYHQN